MGSEMEALEEGCHVDEGHRCWKRYKHGCKRDGMADSVQLSVFVGVDHFAVEGERRKELRLRESSSAVLVAEYCHFLRAPGAPLRFISFIDLSTPPTSLHFHLLQRQ